MEGIELNSSQNDNVEAKLFDKKFKGSLCKALITNGCEPENIKRIQNSKGVPKNSTQVIHGQ